MVAKERCVKQRLALSPSAGKRYCRRPSSLLASREKAAVLSLSRHPPNYLSGRRCAVGSASTPDSVSANCALRLGAARRLWRCGRRRCCTASAPRPSARLDGSIIHAARTHAGRRWSAATPGCGRVSRIVRIRRPFRTHGHPSCCVLAARYQHRRRLPAMDACGMARGQSCVLSTDGPSLQAEDRSSEEEFDDRHSRERQGKDGGS
jgi:hypothetical protein